MSQLTFKKIWYVPGEARWLRLLAYDDSGTLLVNSDVIFYQGKKYSVKIPKKDIKFLTFNRMVKYQDKLNQPKWIKIIFLRDGGLAQACFADGGMMGYSGIRGGTQKLLEQLIGLGYPYTPMGHGDIRKVVTELAAQVPLEEFMGQNIIKILFLAGHPGELSRLRLDQEIRAIDLALRASEHRDIFDIKQHWAVRVADIQAYLLRHKPHIVHFSGHGTPASEIILEDDAGNTHPVPNQALAQLFSVLKDNVRCVVLNACYSESQAIAIAQSVDCVVGMSTAIEDPAAMAFSAAFYQALGYGRSVQTAYELGCSQIGLEASGNASAPQLISMRLDPGTIQFVNS